MFHGGKREGAGRPKGARTNRSRRIAEKALNEGLSPLEYMLGIMRDVNEPTELRFEAAKACAPYIHPRLVSREALETPQPIVHITMSAPEAEAISRKLLEQI
jgi:hypothetical protein